MENGKLLYDVFLNKKELKIFTNKKDLKRKILMELDALYQVR